jgi:hypothetical protein
MATVRTSGEMLPGGMLRGGGVNARRAASVRTLWPCIAFALLAWPASRLRVH